MKTILSLMLVALSAPLLASAQSTAFTYQGRLADGGAPANGSYDLRFTLHDAETAGLQYGPSLTNAPVVVTDGYFLVTLDFGAGTFNGAPRWLQIGVRTNGSVVSHTLLTPRQSIATVPYAIQSLTASNVLGNINDSQLSPNIARLNAPASFAGTVTFNSGPNAPFRVVNPSVVTNLNADLLDGLDSTAFALSSHAHSAADITSGQLNDARLSVNVPLLNRGQTFSGTNIFGSQVIATNASNIFAGSFSGNGASLSNLNALSLTGIVADAALPATVSRLAANQTFTGTALFSPSAGAPFRVGSATLVTNLNTDLLDGLNSTAFWNTAGNTNPGANLFIGTLDNTSLDLRANNQRALRLQPGPLAPNVIGGGAGNSVSAGVSGAVIGGGGPANSAGANYATVAGGTGNAASGASSVVGGGSNNSATNTAATVPGGSGNLAGGANSFAAGQNAQALNAGAFVWSDTSSLNTFTSTAPNTVIFRSVGGVGVNTNAPQSALHVSGTIQSDGLKLTTSPQSGALLVSDAAGNATWQPAAVRALANATSPSVVGGFSNNTVGVGVFGATIAGGGGPLGSNYVGAAYGTVGGGFDNSVISSYSTIGGGFQNRATSTYSVVGGGYNNVGSGTYSTVAGGIQNTSGFYAAISGGYFNNASGSGSFIGGGNTSVASGQESAIAGGFGNVAVGLQSVVVGGNGNRASNTYSAILGGAFNTNSGLAGTIGGGSGNAVTNSYATVPGGSGNVAGAPYSFAAGRNARAVHDGSFVWADNSTTTPLVSTAANQFLIRANAGLFLSGSPSDALLNVQGDTRIFDNEIFLRGGTDLNHGLGWYGTTKPWGLLSVDGPVLYGFAGGALGTATGQKVAVYWNSLQQVGIGTDTPQQSLSVAGGLNIDQAVQNNGTLANTLRFGSFSGEAIGSKRSAGGANPFGLDFYANSAIRMSIENGGFVGIGTTDPKDVLELSAPDATFRVKNSNDGGLGGFIEDTYGAFQFGMSSDSNNVNQVAGGTKRAFFGFNSAGQVGSLVNSLTPSGPANFRNLLDDGSGNMTVSPSGNLSFGQTTRQMMNLWSTIYGIGVQGFTLYFRSDGGFAWFRQGSHNDAQNNPGGGSKLMDLSSTGNLTVSGAYFPSSDRNVKKDFADVNSREILARVAELPLKTWVYTNDAAVRHIGPMAQDFSRAFGVGMDDKHIATVDADGVALAAIQGLNQIVEEKRTEITELKKRNAALETRMDELERLVLKLAARTGSVE